MADLVGVDVAADLGHLEPFQVPQAVRGRADGVANGVVEGVGRGAVDLGDGIDVARHGCPFLIFLLSTGSCRALVLVERWVQNGNDPHRHGFQSRLARRGTPHPQPARSEEHTSELQSLMRNSYAVFCLKKKKQTKTNGTRVTN